MNGQPMITRLGRLLSRPRRRAPPRASEIDRFGASDGDVWRVLFQQALGPKGVMDASGHVVVVNDALRAMTGDAAATPGIAVETLFAAADREAVRRAVAAALDRAAPRGPPRTWTARLETGARTMTAPHGDEGGTRVLASIVPLYRGDGGVSGGVLHFRDISLTTRLEAQLAHSQRLQAAGQLAGGVAHDFNNLLTAILGSVDAIDARGTTDADTQEELTTIRASVGRGAALVRHLLAFGRQQTLQPSVLAVNDVITDLGAMLRRLLGSRIRLQMTLEQPGRLVLADPTALDQVLVNLTVNARDAMPDGGTLTLRSGHMTLHRPLPRGPELIQPGRYVMMEVQDTGGGIPPDVLPHIFDPFYTTRRDRGGSGLGLSTAHGIVLQSGGFVAVESEQGMGTRMRVYLPQWDEADPLAIPRPPAVAALAPVVPAPPQPAPVAATVAAAPGRAVAAPETRGLILLVEDEDTVRRVAERSLSRHGWEVLSADTAEAALDLLAQQQRPRLAAVVTDLMMPGMNGAALVRAVRDLLGMPRLPAIVVSGYAAESLQREIAAEVSGDGAVATWFLAKPYEIKDLAGKLAEIAGR
jgi:two-component system cell cycle sensor histidine kinase/response regulator CckA